MKSPSSNEIGDRSRKGRQRTLNSGVYQQRNSSAHELSVHARRLSLSKTAPLIATQTDSVTTRVRPTRAGVLRLRARCSFTAMANDAGTDANRKNLGPHAQPPYHDHHFE